MSRAMHDMEHARFLGELDRVSGCDTDDSRMLGYQATVPLEREQTSQLLPPIQQRYSTAVRPSHPSDAVAAMYGVTVADGWDVPSWGPLKMDKLIFKPILKGRETAASIKGEELRQRAATSYSNMGMFDGQQMIEHQDKISRTLIQSMCSTYIALSGTLVRKPNDKSLYMPCLRGGGALLFMSFMSMDALFSACGLMPYQEGRVRVVPNDSSKTLRFARRTFPGRY